MENPPKEELQSALDEFLSKFEKNTQKEKPQEEKSKYNGSPKHSPVTKEDREDSFHVRRPASTIRLPDEDTARDELRLNQVMSADNLVVTKAGPDFNAKRPGCVNVQYSEHNLHRPSTPELITSDVKKSQNETDDNVSKNNRKTVPQSQGHVNAGSFMSDGRDPAPSKSPQRVPLKDSFKEPSRESSKTGDLPTKQNEISNGDYSKYFGPGSSFYPQRSNPYQSSAMTRGGSTNDLGASSSSREKDVGRNMSSASSEQEVIQKEGSPVDPGHLRYQLMNSTEKSEYRMNRYSTTSFLPRSQTSLKSNQDFIQESSMRSSAAMDRINEILNKTRQSVNYRHSDRFLHQPRFSNSRSTSNSEFIQNEKPDVDGLGSAVDSLSLTMRNKKEQSLNQLLTGENDRLKHLDRLIKEIPATIGKTPSFSVPSWLAKSERRSRSVGETLGDSSFTADYSSNNTPSGNRSRLNELLARSGYADRPKRSFSPPTTTSINWNNAYTSKKGRSSSNLNSSDSYSYLQNCLNPLEKSTMEHYRHSLASQQSPRDELRGSPYYEARVAVNGTRGLLGDKAISPSRESTLGNNSFNNRRNQRSPVHMMSSHTQANPSKAGQMGQIKNQENTGRLFESRSRGKTDDRGCQFKGNTRCATRNPSRKRCLKYTPYVPDVHNSKSDVPNGTGERAKDRNLSNAVTSVSSGHQQGTGQQAPPRKSQSARGQVTRKCARIGEAFITPLIRGQSRDNISRLKDVSKAVCSLTPSKPKGKTRVKRKQKQVGKERGANCVSKEQAQGRQHWGPRSVFGYAGEQTLVA